MHGASPTDRRPAGGVWVLFSLHDDDDDDDDNDDDDDGLYMSL